MTVVLKVGGAVAAPVQRVRELLETGEPVVLVHGGGPQISAECRTRGIEPQFVDGQRVTDDRVLSVVADVLEAQNRVLVADLRQAGAQAAGVVGALAATPVSDSRLGSVGVVSSVAIDPIAQVLAQGAVPVVSPFAGLNVNADHAAAAVAVALGASELQFVSDVPGVLDTDGTLISRIATIDIPSLVADGTVAGGMLPKLAAGSAAIAGGVWKVWIGSDTLVTA